MPTKKCNICDAEIQEHLFPLHEKFCSSNMVRCPTCDEVVQKEELEEHNDEYHKRIKCEMCGKLMEKQFLSQHKGKCSKKIQQECKYCGLGLTKDEFKEHEVMCGGKTEECCLCKEMVPRCEYDLHIQYVCTGVDREDRKSPQSKSKPSSAKKSNLNSKEKPEKPIKNNVIDDTEEINLISESESENEKPQIKKSIKEGERYTKEDAKEIEKILNKVINKSKNSENIITDSFGLPVKKKQLKKNAGKDKRKKRC